MSAVPVSGSAASTRRECFAYSQGASRYSSPLPEDIFVTTSVQPNTQLNIRVATTKPAKAATTINAHCLGFMRSSYAESR